MNALADHDEVFVTKMTGFAKAAKALHVGNGEGILEALRAATVEPAEALWLLRDEVGRLCGFFAMHTCVGVINAARLVRAEPTSAPELYEVTSRLGPDCLMRWLREVLAAPDAISWQGLEDLVQSLVRPSVADVITDKVSTA